MEIEGDIEGDIEGEMCRRANMEPRVMGRRRNGAHGRNRAPHGRASNTNRGLILAQILILTLTETLT